MHITSSRDYLEGLRHANPSMTKSMKASKANEQAVVIEDWPYPRATYCFTLKSLPC